jgi:hypothetical protein
LVLSCRVVSSCGFLSDGKGKEKLNGEGGLSMQKFWNKGIKCSKQIKALKEEYGKENGRV